MSDSEAHISLCRMVEYSLSRLYMYFVLLLGLTFVHGNPSHVQQPKRINVPHHPAATTRISADGNCFFRSISLVITGSQEFHQELHHLITTHMIH